MEDSGAHFPLLKDLDIFSLEEEKRINRQSDGCKHHSSHSIEGKKKQAIKTLALKDTSECWSVHRVQDPSFKPHRGRGMRPRAPTVETLVKPPGDCNCRE